MFTISDTKRDEALAKQGRDVLVPNEPVHARTIAGLQQKVQELDQQKEELERQNDDLMDNAII